MASALGVGPARAPFYAQGDYERATEADMARIDPPVPEFVADPQGSALIRGFRSALDWLGSSSLTAVGLYAVLRRLVPKRWVQSSGVPGLVAWIPPGRSRRAVWVLWALALSALPRALHVFTARWLGVLPSSNAPLHRAMLGGRSFRDLRQSISVGAVLGEEGWALRRVSVSVRGRRVDALIIGRPERLASRAGRWMLFSGGNGECYEMLAFGQYRRFIESLLDGFQANGVLFNYPGVGSSQGQPVKTDLLKAYRGMMRYVEGPLAAKTIFCFGHSIGAGVQAAALRGYAWRQGVRYVLLRSRSFSALSQTAAAMLAGGKGGVRAAARWVVRGLVRAVGWELDAAAALAARVGQRGAGTSSDPPIIILQSAFPVAATPANRQAFDALWDRVGIRIPDVLLRPPPPSPSDGSDVDMEDGDTSDENRRRFVPGFVPLIPGQPSRLEGLVRHDGIITSETSLARAAMGDSKVAASKRVLVVGIYELHNESFGDVVMGALPFAAEALMARVYGSDAHAESTADVADSKQH